MSDETNMLRRAATACRNAQSQMRGETAWFDWVPQHLDRLADSTTTRAPSPTEGAEDVLRDLYRRITSKVPELERMRAEHAPPESTRLNGKADGMRVAASYVKESLDALVAAVEGSEGA